MADSNSSESDDELDEMLPRQHSLHSQSSTHSNGGEDAISVQRISEIDHEFGAAKTKANELEFGFEGLRNKSGKCGRTGESESNKRKRKRKSNNPPTNGSTNVSEVEPSTSSATHGRSSSNDPPSEKRRKSLSKDPNPNLWAAHKGSKTNLLAQVFEPVAESQTPDGKFMVICTLCPKKGSLSVSKGNNSNLLKHLRKVISHCSSSIHASSVFIMWHFIDSFMIIPLFLKSHPDASQWIDKKQALVSESERDRRKLSSESVQDLIVKLIAKENMQIRIVESPYFRKLLSGKLIAMHCIDSSQIS